MQLITGLIGMFCLCILGSAFITGGEGLLFVIHMLFCFVNFDCYFDVFSFSSHPKPDQ